MGSEMMKEQDHIQAIQKIINDHFDEAEGRIDQVYAASFTSVQAVLKRHWKHKKDIPSDLMSLPRNAWNVVSKIILRSKTKALPKTGKTKEVEAIIADDLLDLKGLEQKIENYVQPYQEEFDKEFADILHDIPALHREKFAKELELKVEQLNVPIEGAREAVVFLLAGIIGKMFSDKVTFGSSIATGKAVAISVYFSQLSWFGSLWAKIFGIPTWVSVAGAGAGLFAALLIAPMLTPVFELGINRFRAKKILRQTIAAARQKLSGKSRDAIDIAGKTAIYLQVLPDVVEMARKTAKAFM